MQKKIPDLPITARITNICRFFNLYVYQGAVRFSNLAGMRFIYSSNVRNSMENVWDFIMDFERRPDWIDFFDKSYITKKTSNWIGTHYKEKLTFLGIPLHIEYIILDYHEQHYFIAKSKMPPFYPVVTVTARDNEDGTIFSSLEFEIKLGPFWLLPKKLIKKQVDDLINPFIDKFVGILDQPE